MKKSIRILMAVLALSLLFTVAVSCVKKEALTMATNADFPPYEFYQDGKIVGIDAEIAEAIAKKLGMELSIEDIDFDSVVMSIETGKYNMAMAGLTVTEDRMEQVNFTTSYAKGVQAIIVPDGSPITSNDDLFNEGAKYRIGVQLSTTGDLYATWDLEDEDLAVIERYQKGADAVMALNTGKIDCVIIDNEPAKVFVSQNPGLKILDTEYTVEDYAIAVNKNETELYEKIDSALRVLIADGTVQSIIDKYINAD
ncbi:MAG: transporter substrate-binding domain-containing protein [Oscillospiraceae bacterium]|nr:transporter substrate-binding domain-containing protein [Oscillospiraceae bacterium]